MSPSVTRMLSRVKLVPFVLESGDGLEGREKVKVLPSPVRVNANVSASAVRQAARTAARERTLMGRIMAAQFLSEDAGYVALVPVLAAAAGQSMEGCRFLPTIVGAAKIHILVVKGMF